jgi:Na+-driven multidrug efflux pump
LASILVILTVFVNADAFFRITKQDEIVSKYAINYIYQFIPAALLITQIDIFRKFLFTIGKGHIVLFMNLFTLMLHILANYIFVS